MIRKTIAGLSLSLAGVGLTHAQSQHRAPNILFIMSDDHTTQAVSSYGGFLGNYLSTPNIDRIGKEGVRLTNCFVTNSISAPSRASILTGQFSWKNGVYANLDLFNRDHPTVAKELQKAGYQTALIGKWHLGTEPAGFDYYNVLPGQGRYYNPLMIRMGDWDKGPNGTPKVTEFSGHSTDVIANETIHYLQAIDPDRPFFLKCHFKAPHRPCAPAHRFLDLLADVTIPEPANLYDDYDGRGAYAKDLRMSMEHLTEADLKGRPFPENMTLNEKRSWAYQYFIKDYLRCVAGIDENVGRILKYLDDNGLAENTIVIYAGDQGLFLGEHGWFDKRLMHDESLRMPLLIRYPKEIKAGTVNNDMVLNIDFAPLFLDYAQIPTPDYMQGESFRKNLKGETPDDWRKSMYYRYWMYNDSVHRVPAHYGIRTERYKLIFYYSQPLGIKGAQESLVEPEWELYDLQNDPAEMRNIYHDPRNRELINELKRALLRLKEKYGDPDSNYPEMEEVVKKYW